MEKRITNNIIKAYRSRGAWVIKIHGNVMQPQTIDLFACYKGRFIGIEVKDGYGKDATPMQLNTLLEIARAGGLTIVAHELSEAMSLLEAIDVLSS